MDVKKKCSLSLTAVASLAIVVILVLTLIPIPRAAAPSIAVASVSLPESRLYVGSTIKSDIPYAASFMYGDIVRFNVGSGTYETILSSTGLYQRQWWGVAVDDSGVVWAVRDSANDGGQPGVVKIQNGVETRILSGPFVFYDIVYLNGFVYTASSSSNKTQILYKINVNTGVITQKRIDQTDRAEFFLRFKTDGANVWFVDKRDGYLYRYTPSTDVLTRFTGFNRPTGMAFSGDQVYVAENVGRDDPSLSPAIANLTVSSGVISRISVVGSPRDVSVWNGFIAWTSDGTDLAGTVKFGVITSTGLKYDILSSRTSLYNLNVDTSGRLYATFSGSAGITRLENWANDLSGAPAYYFVRASTGEVYSGIGSLEGAISTAQSLDPDGVAYADYGNSQAPMIAQVWPTTTVTTTTTSTSTVTSTATSTTSSTSSLQQTVTSTVTATVTVTQTVTVTVTAGQTTTSTSTSTTTTTTTSESQTVRYYVIYGLDPYGSFIYNGQSYAPVGSAGAWSDALWIAQQASSRIIRAIYSDNPFSAAVVWP